MVISSDIQYSPQPIYQAQQFLQEQDEAAGKVEASGESKAEGEKLTSEEQRKLQELKRKDAEVRRQKRSQKAIAGSLSQGSPKFKYEIGPDGKKYAVSGEISFNTYFGDVESDPEAVLKKARKIKRAALMGGTLTARDRQALAAAAEMEQRAKRIIARKQEEENPLGFSYNEDGTKQDFIVPSFYDLFA